MKRRFVGIGAALGAAAAVSLSLLPWGGETGRTREGALAVDTASAQGLVVRLYRKDDRFTIELEGPEATWGGGPGTYVVYVPFESVHAAVSPTGVPDHSVVLDISGEYDTYSPARLQLKSFRIGMDLVSSGAQGMLPLGVARMGGSLLGLDPIMPIVDPSQLAEIALDLGDKYVAAVGKANRESKVFGELLKVLQDGRAGILLVAGKSYRIDVLVDSDMETTGMDFDLTYTRSHCLPNDKSMQQLLTRYLTGYRSFGKPVSFTESVSVSLPPLVQAPPEPSGRTGIVGVWSGTFHEYRRSKEDFPFILQVADETDGKFRGILSCPLKDAVTTCHGLVDGNELEWRELKLEHGPPGIILNGVYRARFVTEDRIEGRYFFPPDEMRILPRWRGQEGGSFVLDRHTSSLRNR